MRKTIRTSWETGDSVSASGFCFSAGEASRTDLVAEEANSTPSAPGPSARAYDLSAVFRSRTDASCPSIESAEDAEIPLSTASAFEGGGSDSSSVVDL